MRISYKSTYLCVLFVFLATLPIYGCIAALPLIDLVAMAAMPAMYVAGEVQMRSGGKLSITFDDSSITQEAKQLLKNSKRFGIWGENAGLARVADVLDSTGRFEVLGPVTMTEFAKQAQVSATQIGSMSKLELERSFAKVCDVSRADSLIAVLSDFGGIDMNFMATRTTQSFNETIILFDCNAKVRLRDIKGVVKVESGAVNQLSMAEVMDAGGAALGEKLAEMAGAPVKKDTTAQKGGNIVDKNPSRQ